MTASDNRADIRRLRRLLKEISELAQHASLTGALREGAPSAIRRYNAVLQQLERLGAVTPGFFGPLAETAGYDELGVDSKLLAGYIKEEGFDAESLPHDPHGNVIIGLGGLGELAELKDLGKMIREQFPDWLRGQQERHRERSERHRERSQRGAESGPDQAETLEPASLSEVESGLAEAGSKLQAVAEQLRRGDLSDEQRAILADLLSQLSQEQANLARRHAALRQQGRE